MVSADSHPVHGAYVFHVGAPGADPEGLASEVLAADQLARSVSVTFTTVRFLTLGLTLFTVGGVVALVLVLTAVAPALRRTLLVVLACTAAALGLVSLFGILLQGAEASGLGIGEAFDPSLLRSVLETRFGQVSLGRAAIAGALVALLLGARRGLRATGILLDLALVLCVGLVLAPAAAGTPTSAVRSRSWPTSSTSRPRRSGWAALRSSSSPSSWLAAAAGSWQPTPFRVSRSSPSWPLPRCSSPASSTATSQVQDVVGLWETSYGRLLLVKVALLMPLLALGAYNRRRSVPRLEAGDGGAREQRAFLRSTGVELALMVAVIAVTAVLVAEPPARALAAAGGAASVSTTLGELDLELVVDPARAGDNAIDLYLLEPSGRPADVEEVRVAATLAAQGLGPLRADARRLAIGHWAVEGFDFPLAGTWQLLVEARRGEFESLSTRVPLEIEEAG